MKFSKFLFLEVWTLLGCEWRSSNTYGVYCHFSFVSIICIIPKIASQSMIRKSKSITINNYLFVENNKYPDNQWMLDYFNLIGLKHVASSFSCSLLCGGENEATITTVWIVLLFFHFLCFARNWMSVCGFWVKRRQQQRW